MTDEARVILPILVALCIPSLVVIGVAFYYSRSNRHAAEARAHRAAARDWLDRHPFEEGDRVLWGNVRATVEEVSIDGATVLLATDTGSYEWVRTKDITRIMRAA